MGLIERCPTGIEGLYDLLEGGFPRGNIVLLAGTPGAGKTTFAAKFIYEGAKRYGEPGVYLSFLEPKYDFIKYMKALGMDFEELERKGLFTYIEGVQTQTVEGVEEALREFLKAVLEMRAKRAVIDSATAITQIVGFRGSREIIKNAIIAGLKPLNVTALLIAELPIGTPVVGYGVEEFLVDGVIILRSIIENGVLIRKMEIRKMRGSEIPRAEVFFDIVPGKGIRVYVPEKIEEVPAPSEEIVYESPIPELTHVLGPSLSKGTQIAIIAQEGSAGLTIALAMVLPFIARYGGKLLVRSYGKPSQLIKSLIEEVATTYGIDCSKINMLIDPVQPTSKPIYLLSARNREMDLSIKPDFEILDSLNQLPALYGWSEYLSLHIDNLLTRRRLNITAFYIYYERKERPLPLLLDIYDKIVKIMPEHERNCYVIRSFMAGIAPYLKPVKICFSEKGIEWGC